MTGGVLDVLERHASFTRAGDEGDPEGVRAQLGGAGELGPLGDATHHAPGLGLAHAPACRRDEEWAKAPATEVVAEGAHCEGGEYGPIASAALAASPGPGTTATMDR